MLKSAFKILSVTATETAVKLKTLLETLLKTLFESLCDCGESIYSLGC